MIGQCNVMPFEPEKIEVKGVEKALNRVCIALNLGCIAVSIFVLCAVLIACV